MDESGQSDSSNPPIAVTHPLVLKRVTSTIPHVYFLLESFGFGVHATAINPMSAHLKVAESPGSIALVAPLRPALIKYFLRKCGNASEAEDLAQDVLERALQHAQWESAEQAKGYIFRIAVNRWHDRNRRGRTHGVVVEWDDTASFAQAEETSPERVLSSEQELHAVVEALESLSERTRDVFLLFRLEQMKHGQIAEMFGISVSAVEKHVSKAVAHLARRAAR